MDKEWGVLFAFLRIIAFPLCPLYAKQESARSDVISLHEELARLDSFPEAVSLFPCLREYFLEDFSIDAKYKQNANKNRNLGLSVLIKNYLHSTIN